MCEHNWIIDDCYTYDEDGFPVREHECRSCHKVLKVIDPELIGSISQYDKFWNILRKIAEDKSNAS